MTKTDTSLQIATDAEGLPDVFTQGQEVRLTLSRMYMLLTEPTATLEQVQDLLVAADNQLTALTTRANQSAAVERGLLGALDTLRQQRNDLVARMTELEDGFEERVDFELSAHYAGEKQRALDVKRLANDIAAEDYTTIREREEDKLSATLHEARERAEWYTVVDPPDDTDNDPDPNDDGQITFKR